VAMQLTNILRDIREDERLGRLYLPGEDLRRFGSVSPDLVAFEAERASDWFDRGLQLTEMLDARSAACVLAMTGIYREILARIIEDPARVLTERISLSGREKAWVAVRSLATARSGAAA